MSRHKKSVICNLENKHTEARSIGCQQMVDSWTRSKARISNSEVAHGNDVFSTL